MHDFSGRGDTDIRGQENWVHFVAVNYRARRIRLRRELWPHSSAYVEKSSVGVGWFKLSLVHILKSCDL